MKNLLSETKNELMDELLVGICKKLQITKSMRNDAEQKYSTIGNWLADKDSILYRFKPVIYPQGSFRIRTTVKPIGRDEFDLDCVCELMRMTEFYEPQYVYNLIEKRLKENKIYFERLERFKRCVRIKYAGDFHLDITPACPDLSRNDGSILVTDTKMQEWKESNPVGFADWFEQRCRVEFEMKKIANVERLPEHEESEEKPPLKHVVQLMKRHRDIAFQGMDESPRSIVLTTLAGYQYLGQNSVFESLTSVVDHILNLIRTHRILVVKNPVNEEETFSESWQYHPEQYQEFVEFMENFALNLQELSRAQGLHRISELLERLFGEQVARSVIEEHSDGVSQLRSDGVLGVSGGLSILTDMEDSTQISRNTFYGN